MLEWISKTLEQAGYAGIVLLMLGENVFPPIPSEIIMPLAGFTAAQGELTLILAILAGVLGSILGAVFWFEIGRKIGTKDLQNFAAKHGRWLTLTPEEVKKASAWFERHGAMAVFLGRLVPAVRTLISVPAGVARMPYPKFLLYSTLGTILWTAFLTIAGYFLGQNYDAVKAWLGPISNILVFGGLAYYAYRVATWEKRSDPD